MKLSRNKVLLRWREPKYYLKYEKRHLTWKDRLRVYAPLFTKTGLFFIGLWIFVRLVRQDGELISWPAIVVGIVAGLFVCLMTWLISFAPIEVLVREKDIVKRAAEGTVSLSYKDMQKCTVREIYLDTEKAYILEVRMNNGKEWELEIAPEIVQQEIKEILEERGVGVTR